MRFIIAILFIIVIVVPVHSQIVMDGTMGTPGPLQGPHFDIRSEYGQQAGQNLFHSFGQFNVNTGETATFSGPSSVQNIVGRVTGGNSSWIDGTLGSTIDGANLYLLNPAGVMFGPHACLDLSGSFHVSTSDYLRLGENDRFYTEPFKGEVLSSAEPAAFGFLDDDPASVSLDQSKFSLNEGQTLSLIGGEIQIRGSEITAPAGQINMVSLALAGEAEIPEDEAIDESQIPKRGNIMLSEGSSLDTDGAPSGNIFIRCGTFVAQDSEIKARNFAYENGGLTDIQANEISIVNTAMLFTLASEDVEGENITGNGERVRLRASDSLCLTDTYIEASNWGIGDGAEFLIEAPQVSLTNASISCIAERPGDAGNITINADSVSLLESRLLSESSGIGDAGKISIDAENVSLENHSMISSYSGDGIGQGGDIRINASESVSIASGSTIYAAVAGPASHTADAGDIEINAKEISLTDGGVIATSTYIAGKGGDITLDASETVRLSGADALGNASQIYSSTYSKDESAGNAGQIHIRADRLRLEDHANINASTEGPGNVCGPENPHSIELNLGTLGMDTGSFIASASNFTENGGAAGPIRITAEGSVSLKDNSSVTTSSKGQGNAADITLETPALGLNDESLISSSSNSQAKGGHAGTIDLRLGNLDMNTGAVISSISKSQAGGGQAGEIIIHAEDSVRLSGNSSLTTDAGATGGGQISVTAGDSIHLLNAGLTSSVGQGEGQGGDVTAESKFVILNRGAITANADQGDGGAVFIQTENFLKSSDSQVTATSNRGNEGSVRIEAPDVDVSSALTALSGNLLDASRWMKTPCAQRSGADVSHFVIRERDGIPHGFDDWLASPPLVSERPGDHSWECFVRRDFAGTVRALEDKEIRIPDAVMLAHAYGALGHYRKARAALDNASLLAEESGDPRDNALFFSALGDIHLLLGDMRKGIQYAKKGLNEARTSENSLVIASVLNNLGNIRAVSKNHSGAMNAYQESLALMGQPVRDELRNQSLSLKSKVMINMARAELARGKHENALTTAEHARIQIETQADTCQKAEDLIALSLVVRNILNASDSDRLRDSEILRDPARIWLRDAARIGEKMGNARIISCAYGLLAQYHEDDKQFQDAIQLTRKAIFSAQQGYFPELLYRWQWQMGRLLSQERDIAGAVEFYRDAIATLNPIRMEFFNGFRGRNRIFDEKVRPIYMGLAKLLLEQAEHASSKPRHSNPSRPSPLAPHI